MRRRALTALRWVGTLEEAGFVRREHSELDRRVAYVKLSATGFTAIRRHLIEAARYLRPAHRSFMLRGSRAMNAPESRLHRTRTAFSGRLAGWRVVYRRVRWRGPMRRSGWELWAIVAIVVFTWINALWLVLAG